MKEIENLVNKYVVSGVPESSIKGLMFEANRSVEKFKYYMADQTVACVGDESLYYVGDVIRFLENKEVID